ncbi:hypothetical protein AVEN_157092-1 [Araneus ventricosus]|uniref:Uncharacterized protein n=1 Tax=Araneus ventricosus TaxID=182803 RepID=A0A4Y2FYW1_ARAVE|nr:hypothetical protein AVEN_157092-1 [Araneus ventricosus]
MVASRKIYQSEVSDFIPFQWSPRGGSPSKVIAIFNTISMNSPRLNLPIKVAILYHFNGRLEEEPLIRGKRFYTISMVASRRICRSKVSDFIPFQWSPGRITNQIVSDFIPFQCVAWRNLPIKGKILSISVILEETIRGKHFIPFQWSPRGSADQGKRFIHFNGICGGSAIKAAIYTISMVAGGKICKSKVSDFIPFLVAWRRSPIKVSDFIPFPWWPRGRSTNQR